MWEGAPTGAAPERIHMDGVYPQNDADVITTGGSGFGIAGLIVGIEREFIPRDEGVERLHQIADFLSQADRYHGVWAHWINGPTGKTKAFSTKDNGADLVESAFLIQGLLIARVFQRGKREFGGENRPTMAGDGGRTDKQIGMGAPIGRRWISRWRGTTSA